MSTRMLIDARHDEETRVAIAKGNRIEEFDYESATKRQLKGNIYLAKVTRVEPSLQAAFVEYGGNRHGFLAFSEIHPDYYQIPQADRDALLAEEESEQNDVASEDVAEEKAVEDKAAKTGDDDDAEPESPEQISGDDDIDEIRPKRRPSRRRYKIQEVIRRRQILLVQVVKEERGNKGAALTTYLSLAGRYCVLMPNSTTGGGISRKIASQADRRRLKDVMSGLQVPKKMGCIIRTAGMSRTKTEIKRDFDYLLRLWEGIRELTLKSVAPALIYEEGNLIKRSIRDLYTRDIDEVLVEGENGYRSAKDFMRLLMPSHAKKVQHYKDRIPLFHRYQVESQLESMYNPTVQLKSGGYIVINPTEALVAIDVNSGRSTREHNIEETALKTNIEAAEEVARQLRLRDLAGLVVIDFIDMEERNNNKTVERRMKDALKTDRARIQVGRISSFGLMEMSRQRLRPNLLEASMGLCPTCAGTGVVRSTETAALQILRALEEEGIRARSTEVTIKAPSEVAIYLLNQKREALSQLEAQYGYHIIIEMADSLDGVPYEMERITGHVTPAEDVAEVIRAGVEAPEEDDDETVEDEEPEVQARQDQSSEDDEDGKPKRKRRRRRRRGRRGRGGSDDQQTSDTQSSDDPDSTDTGEHAEEGNNADGPDTGDETGEDKTKRRRRRRRRKDSEPSDGDNSVRQDAPDHAPEEVAIVADDAQTEVGIEIPVPEAEEKPKRRRRSRKKAEAEADTTAEAAQANTEVDDSVQAEDKPKPTRRRRKKVEAEAEAPAEDASSEASIDAPVEAEAEAAKPKRRRAPRRKANDADTAPAQAADTDEGVSTAEEKPKRRRTRKPKADSATETPAASAPELTQDTAAAANTNDQKPAAKVEVSEKGGIEVQKVVVGDAAGSSAGAAAEEASEKKPRKGGWWQRTFGN